MGRAGHYNVAPREGLTPRQQEVLALMARGRTNGQIADELGITIDGAKFHVSEILNRLGVSSREEAVAAWRQGRTPAARFRALTAGLALKPALLAAGGVVLVGAVAAGAFYLVDRPGDDGPAPATNVAAVTAADVIAAVQQPGKVVHLLMEVRRPDAPATTGESWYASDLDAVRLESKTMGMNTAGVPQETTIIVPGRRASLWHADNLLHDGPLTPDPADPLSPALSQVTHVAMLTRADTVEFRGEEVVDGETLLRFDIVQVLDTPDERGEQPDGTTHRGRLYLRPADLLPAHIEFATEIPGDGTHEVSVTVHIAEMIDLAALPADLFDPDTLSGDLITPDEAMDVVARQPFATFWLGPVLDVRWRDPRGNGADAQEVVIVGVDGVPGIMTPDDGSVFIGYGPPDIPSLTLVEIRQGAAGTFALPQGWTIEAARAAGNSEPLSSGDGYLYVEYMPRGTCSFEAAQSDPACRVAGPGRWGAVLDREGTTIHVVAMPKFDGADPSVAKDTNPFNSRDAILALVEQLQRVP